MNAKKVTGVVEMPMVGEIYFARPKLYFSLLGLLSTLSITIFGCKLHQDPKEVTKYKDVVLQLTWVYSSRVLSSILTWFTAVTVICGLCKNTPKMDSDDEETVLIVTSEQDFVENYVDGVEVTSLL